MKKLTYWQLRKKSKLFLWNYGIDNRLFDNGDVRMGLDYWSKSTLLELLSVTHREWKK